MRIIVRYFGKLLIYSKDRLLGSLINRLMFYAQDVNTLDFPKTKGAIYINNKGSIEIGKNVSINSSPDQNPIGGGSRCNLITRKGARIAINSGSCISNCVLYAFESISIGKNVFIGNGCKIYDSDFHSLDLKKRLSKPDAWIRSKEVEIKDGAFIGAHSIILKGVKIGENSIVGAGSVVSKSIPDEEIWAGNPACFIRSISKNQIKNKSQVN